MADLTMESSIEELTQALKVFAERKGWQDIQVSLCPDEIFCVFEPEYAAEDHDEFEKGDLVGFVETHCCTTIQELGELLAGGQ
jgi:hypothetical protein